MQAILMGFAICVLGVMVTMLLFAIAMRPDEDEMEASEEFQAPVTAERFFADEVVAAGPVPGVPLEATLIQLEQHVRKEQEAARVFLQGPSPESLQAPSDSPFWH